MGNGMMRGLAMVVVFGMALGGPGTPMALAQLEMTQDQASEVMAACQGFDPALREDAISIAESVTAAATAPETATPQDKATLEAVERGAVAIHEAATDTVARLDTTDPAIVQQVLSQQANVPQAVAQELAQACQKASVEAQKLMKEGKPLEATKAIDDAKAKFREYNVDPGILASAGGREGKLTAETVFFGGRESLGAPDFIGRAIECHNAVEAARAMEAKYGGEMGHGPMDVGLPSFDKMAEQIQKMNVPEAEKAKMLEVAQKIHENITNGEFRGACEVYHSEVQVADAKAQLDKMLEKGTLPDGTTITPEMQKQMTDQFKAFERGGMGGGLMEGHMPMEMGGYVPTPEAMAAMTPDQRVAYEDMRTMGAAMQAGTPSAEVYREMMTNETMFREYTSPTQDAPRTESSGYAEQATRVLVAAHDHNGDGHIEHYHYDTNRDGVADVVEVVGL